MIKTFFYLKADKKNTAGESAIYAKIKLDSQSTTLSTGRFISKERWVFTNKLRNKLRLHKEKNCKITLDILESKIETTYFELLKTDPNTTITQVKNKLNGKFSEPEQIDILTLFNKHNTHFKQRVEAGERSKASLQKYNRAKKLLANYLRVKYFKTSFNVDDIDSKFIYKLEDFLKYESTFKDRIGISHNSVVKYFRSFKTVCEFGIKRKMIKDNPFSIYREKLISNEPVFLTKQELERIESKNFSTDRLNRVKDIFIFSCYTSYAPIDVKNLTINNLVKDASGTIWIKTKRAKTNIKSNVPVLPPVQRIIDKYSSLEGTTLLPKISNQKMNEYLKEIADLCGIPKKLTHYVARHTFATTVTLGNGVKIENVSSMMGHTRISMTQHYAKVLDENIKRDMDKLKTKIW